MTPVFLSDVYVDSLIFRNAAYGNATPIKWLHLQLIFACARYSYNSITA